MKIELRRHLKTAARFLVRTVMAVPGSRFLLKRAALVDPTFKTPAFETAWGLIADTTIKQGEFIETNLGIAPELRFLAPARKYHLVFGRPENHVGDCSTLQLAELLASESDVFLDVGANEGLYAFSIALSLGRTRHATIHAFEPDPELFDRLSQNLKRNGVDAVVNRLAVGASSGSGVFYRNLVDDHSGTMNPMFVPGHDKEPVDIEVVTLADYLSSLSARRACVKVDAEGFGVEVWSGARNAADRISSLIIEIVGPEWDAGLPGQIVRESGWHAYYIREFELQHWTHGLYDYKAHCFNWLFCNRTPSQLGAFLAASPFHVIDRATASPVAC